MIIGIRYLCFRIPPSGPYIRTAHQLTGRTHPSQPLDIRRINVYPSPAVVADGNKDRGPKGIIEKRPVAIVFGNEGEGHDRHVDG